MDIRKIKRFVRLHWIKVLLITVGSIFVVILIILLIVGTKSFFGLESFYKRMALANVPLQLFLTVITGFIFATIYVYMWFHMLYGGGLAKMGQKKNKI